MVNVRIDGIDDYSPEELVAELHRGGRFVFFEYCISLLCITLRRPSRVLFVPAGELVWLHGLPYTMATFFLGWWGLPWGAIYTPMCLATNLAGGCDVTHETCIFLGLSAEESI
jgi:hypothetical protein